MQSAVYMKQGDTLPVLYAHLLGGGAPLDLASATVVFQVDNLLTKPCTILSPASGHISYHWDAGDTDQSGTYRAVFVVTYADGSVLTCPTSGYISLVIEPR